MAVQVQGGDAASVAGAFLSSGPMKSVDASGRWVNPDGDADVDVEAVADGALGIEDEDDTPDTDVSDEEVESIVRTMDAPKKRKSAPVETRGDDADDDDDDADDKGTEDGDVEDGKTKALRDLLKLLGIDEPAQEAVEEVTEGTADKVDPEELRKLPAEARYLYDAAKGRATSLAKSLADSQEHIKALENQLATSTEAIAEALPKFDAEAFERQFRASLKTNDRYADFSDSELDDIVDAQVARARARHDDNQKALRDVLAASSDKIARKRKQADEAYMARVRDNYAQAHEASGGNEILARVTYDVMAEQNMPPAKAVIVARDRFEKAVLDHLRDSPSFGVEFQDSLLKFVQDGKSSLGKKILASVIRSHLRPSGGAQKAPVKPTGTNGTPKQGGSVPRAVSRRNVNPNAPVTGAVTRRDEQREMDLLAEQVMRSMRGK